MLLRPLRSKCIHQKQLATRGSGRIVCGRRRVGEIVFRLHQTRIRRPPTQQIHDEVEGHEGHAREVQQQKCGFQTQH